MESRLQNFVHDIENRDLAPSDHLDLHALFVSVLAANWRSYINYLEDRFLEMVRPNKSNWYFSILTSGALG